MSNISGECTSNDTGNQRDLVEHFSQLKLVAFVFDERFVNIHTLGSEFDLSLWYAPGTRISHVSFATGREEILLVDSSGLARIFSLVTLQFKLETFTILFRRHDH